MVQKNLDKSGKTEADHVSSGTSLARHSSSREDADVQRTNWPLEGAADRQRFRPDAEKEEQLKNVRTVLSMYHISDFFYVFFYVW